MCLPGSTGSSVSDKQGRNATSRAALTLRELERWLLLEIARQVSPQGSMPACTGRQSPCGANSQAPCLSDCRGPTEVLGLVPARGAASAPPRRHPPVWNSLLVFRARPGCRQGKLNGLPFDMIRGISPAYSFADQTAILSRRAIARSADRQSHFGNAMRRFGTCRRKADASTRKRSSSSTVIAQRAIEDEALRKSTRARRSRERRPHTPRNKPAEPRLSDIDMSTPSGDNRAGSAWDES